MKAKEREIARRLRRSGWSVRTIARQIRCSKSTVSKWIQDIPLTAEQIEKLKSNQDKGRAKAANHPNSPKQKWERIRSEISERAHREIPTDFSNLDLKILGTALYWAEGYTASRNLFVFANTDPYMIKLMLQFLRDICKIKNNKLRGRVNIHPHLDIRGAHKYWSRISGIPLRQFHKPLFAVSKASKQKRKTLPYGTFRIIVSDVVLCSKIKGWIEGMRRWAIGSVG